MSYQPPPPETTPLGAPTGAQPTPNIPTPLLDALIARNLDQVPAELRSGATPLEGYPSLPNPDPNASPPLYGEPPGEGYLYARDPEARQRAMVQTNPDVVRVMLLRAMETASINALLPFNETDVEKQGRAALAFAQAYLLIDPTVDAEGVNVAHKAAVGAMAQMATDQAKPQPQPVGAAGSKPRPGASSKGSSSKSNGSSGSSGSSGSKQAVSGSGSSIVESKGPTVGGHAEPHKILTSTAGEMLRQMHENAEAVLKGARGSLPRPRPRVNA